MAQKASPASESLPFPRGIDTPRESPIFWAENKDRFLRQLMVKDIETLTGRPLGIYFAQRSLHSAISAADIDRLSEVVRELDVSPFDLLVETPGGETDAAEAMISLLMTTRHPFRAIVPHRAKSNGTLICLAAETVMMGPTSELGPIEPLVDNIPASALLEQKDDEFSVFRFHAKHAMDQTRSVARRALTHKMMSPAADHPVDSAIEALCGRTKFPSHGSVIDSTQAIEIGLKVERAADDDPVWQRVWLLYCMLQHDTQVRMIPKIFETRRVSLAVINGGD